MKKILEAILIYIIVVAGIATAYQMVKPRASICIEDGGTTIYYRNLTIEQANDYISRNRGAQ